MLKSICIRNFRSCADVEIADINQSLLFVGPNNAGKTTILKAICWARDVATKGGMLDTNAFFSQSTVELRFNIDGNVYCYVASACSEDAGSPLANPYYEEVLSVAKPAEQREIFRRSGEELISSIDGAEQSFAIGRLTSTFKFLDSITPDSISEIRKIGTFLKEIKYSAFDSLDDGGKWSTITDERLGIWKAGGTPLENTEAAVCMIKLVDLWLNKKEVFEELVALLGADRLNLLRDIRVHEGEEPMKSSAARNKRYTVIFESPSGFVAYEELSFGTKRILHILMAMLYEPGSVLLLEQPEDGIHPGLLTRLIRVLLSYVDPMQVIFTSHSPAVINSVDAEDIRIVQPTGDKTSVHALSGDELERAAQYVRSTGQLADYIRLLEE